MKNEVRGLFADAITLINASGLPVVAVDIPSGLDTDKGMPLGVADAGRDDGGARFRQARRSDLSRLNYVGDLVVADIGIAEAAVAEVAPKTELLERETIRWLVPRRDPDTHKGTYGHLVGRRRLARQNRRGDSCVPRRYAHGRGIGDVGCAALAQ